MANTSLTIGNEITGNSSRPDFIPESDTCPYMGDGIKINDNFQYKKWCEETFDNGDYVYEAYKNIAFNMKYTPEPPKTDFWQTPLETARLKEGDCEDVVFYFFSLLSPDHKDAEIVWGWVIDRQLGAARAHVWYQLIDREGKEYIVEGFSDDWNGIIPMETVEKTETRKPIFKISHIEARRLLTLISRPDSLDTYQMIAELHRSTDFVKIDNNNKVISQDAVTRYHLDAKRIGMKNMSREFKMSWKQPVNHRINTIVGKEISKIFKKLHVLFTRYEKQGKDNNASLQVAYGNINHFRRNLNCKR